MGRRRARTPKAQRLMEVEPPAMVDNGIAQQCQIGDSEDDLEDSDIEEIGWRDGLTHLETHVVNACWWRIQTTIGIAGVRCRMGGESPFPWDSGMQKASWRRVAFR